MTMFYGFNPPFIGGKSKYFTRQEDEQLVKNNVLQILSTIPGERVMRPDFGVNLRNMVFERINPVSIDLLRDEIITAIRKYEPRINVLQLNITSGEDRNSLIIKLYANFKQDPQTAFEFIRAIEVGNV